MDQNPPFSSSHENFLRTHHDGTTTIYGIEEDKFRGMNADEQAGIRDRYFRAVRPNTFGIPDEVFVQLSREEKQDAMDASYLANQPDVFGMPAVVFAKLNPASQQTAITEHNALTKHTQTQETRRTLIKGLSVAGGVSAIFFMIVANAVNKEQTPPPTPTKIMTNAPALTPAHR